MSRKSRCRVEVGRVSDLGAGCIVGKLKWAAVASTSFNRNVNVSLGFLFHFKQHDEQEDGSSHRPANMFCSVAQADIQVPVVSLDVPWSKSSERQGMRVSSPPDLYCLYSCIVLALAWTRADKDQAYTKLDLMDEPSVEDFFSKNKVDGELSRA